MPNIGDTLTRTKPLGNSRDEIILTGVTKTLSYRGWTAVPSSFGQTFEISANELAAEYGADPSEPPSTDPYTDSMMQRDKEANDRLLRGYRDRHDAERVHFPIQADLQGVFEE